ncbi:MAG: ABC transporter ATP-binding protein [Hominilimicola sp.]
MIEVSSLTKKYGEHTAVDNLSFSIEDGHIYGFLGPNGAGKSTTMNIMTGCLAATVGKVTIDGYDIFEEPVKAKSRIGYLPEQPPLYQDMTPREYLMFVAEAKGIQKDVIKAQVDEAIEKTQIGNVSDRLIKNLSKGYKQRVGIAQALLGNPSTIILDEPTVGLDPNQIIEIRSLITELGKTHTIILSSHILSEVQAVCDRIIIISKGKLVANDTPENLENLFAGTAQLKLTIKGGREEVAQVLNSIDEISDITVSQSGAYTEAAVSFPPETETAETVFFEFAKAGMPIIRMNTERASLEDIFIELTKTDDLRSIIMEEDVSVSYDTDMSVSYDNDNSENNDGEEQS